MQTRRFLPERFMFSKLIKIFTSLIGEMTKVLNVTGYDLTYVFSNAPVETQATFFCNAHIPYKHGTISVPYLDYPTTDPV